MNSDLRAGKTEESLMLISKQYLAADEQWDFLHCKIAHILKQGWRFVDWSSPLRAQNRIKYDPDNWMTLDKKGQAIFIDPDAENPVVPADVVKVALLQKVLHKSPDFKKL